MQTVRIPDDLARTLVSAHAYATGEIHEAYRWLRANNPLGVAEVEGFDPFWVATKHADILEISRNNARFPSAVRATTLTSKAGDARARAITGTPHLVRSIVQMDEPDHMKYRLLIQAWLAPANVRKREEEVRTLAREAVAFLQQHLQQVLGRELLVTPGERQRLGGLDSLFGAVGIEVEIHFGAVPSEGGKPTTRPSMKRRLELCQTEVGVTYRTRKTRSLRLMRAGVPA